MQDYYQIYDAAVKEQQELKSKQAVLEDRINKGCELFGFDPKAENLQELIESKKQELEATKKECEDKINETLESLKELGINV